MEIRVIGFLKKQGKPVPQRDVYRALNISVGELERVIQPLVRYGIINNASHRTRSGKIIKTYEAV